jgi:hypothetical protein
LSTMTMKMTSKGLRPSRVVLSNVAVRLKRPLTLRLSIEYQFARAHRGNVPSVCLHLTWAPAALLCQPLFSALETITTTPLDLSFREVSGHVLLLARAEVCYVSTPVHEATASWRGNCMPSSPHVLHRTSGTQLSSIKFLSTSRPFWYPTLQFSVCLLHQTKPFAKLVKTCSGRNDTKKRMGASTSIMSLSMLSGKHCICHVRCVFVYGYIFNADVMANLRGLRSPIGQNSTA